MGHDPYLAYVSTYETMTPGLIIDREDFFRNIVKNHLPTKRPMDDLEMHATLPYEEEYAIANLSPYSFYHAWYFPKNWKNYFDEYVTFKNNNNGSIDRWKKTYDYFLKKISYKNNGKPILLKSLVNTAKIKHILDLYPKAKFIHIHRNPYDVYFSTWKLYQSILPLFSFQHVDSKTLDEYILYSYKELFLKYLQEKNMIPKKNLVEIGYDNFVQNPIELLKDIYDQFQISSFEKAKSFFETYVDKHRNYQKTIYHYKNSVKQKIYQNWKFMFDAYHYSK